MSQQSSGWTQAVLHAALSPMQRATPGFPTPTRVCVTLLSDVCCYMLSAHPIAVIGPPHSAGSYEDVPGPISYVVDGSDLIYQTNRVAMSFEYIFNTVIYWAQPGN